MTYKKWEKLLKKHLSPLSKEERDDALDYYYEIFSDKLEAGRLEEDIVQEFGNPETCALRILNETNKQPRHTRSNRKRTTPWEIIGMFFLTLVLILPLAASAFSVAVAFGAAATSGLACILAGVLYIPLSFFLGFASFGAILANIGIGITSCGVGVFLYIGFGFVAKYTAIGSWKALKFIYKRG